MGKAKLIVVAIGALALMAVGTFFPAPMPKLSMAAEVVARPLNFPLYNTLITAWIAMAILVLLSWISTRRMELVPRGWQNFAEMVVEALWGLVENGAGRKYAKQFFPIVATIFLYVLMSNWQTVLPFWGTVGLVEPVHEGQPQVFNEASVGGLKVALLANKADAVGQEGILVPFLRTPSTDLNFTFAIAISAVVAVEFFGFRNLGFRTYAGKFIKVGSLLRARSLMGIFMGLIDIFVGALEAVSELIRIVSFGFRLFGNMFAGEVVLAVMTFLIAWLGPVMFYGLELFIGLIQALIFAALTLAFAAVAVAMHEAHQGESGSR